MILNKYRILPLAVRRLISVVAVLLLSPLLLLLLVIMIAMLCFGAVFSSIAIGNAAGYVYGFYMIVMAPILVSSGRTIGITEEGVEIEGMWTSRKFLWKDVKDVRKVFSAPSWGFEISLHSGRLVKIGCFDVTENMHNEFVSRGYNIN